MPTKKKRVEIIPEGMGSLLNPDEAEATCPGVYDGSRMKQKDPVKYSQIVTDLAAGVPVSRIKKTRGVGLGTIAMVRAREKELIEQGKVVVKSLTSMATVRSLEVILTKLDDDKIPAGVLPILFGILRDKEVRDQGEATQTVKVEHTVSLEDVRAKLADLKKVSAVDPGAGDVIVGEIATANNGPAGDESAGG